MTALTPAQACDEYLETVRMAAENLWNELAFTLDNESLLRGDHRLCRLERAYLEEAERLVDAVNKADPFRPFLLRSSKVEEAGR